MSIVVIKQGHSLVVEGNTFPFKEYLKAQGGIWNPRARHWTLPASNQEEITAFLGAGSKRNRPYWICCDECVVIDAKRMHTACTKHAIDGNSFRVRGAIYTGD